MFRWWHTCGDGSVQCAANPRSANADAAPCSPCVMTAVPPSPSRRAATSPHSRICGGLKAAPPLRPAPPTHRAGASRRRLAATWKVTASRMALHPPTRRRRRPDRSRPTGRGARARWSSPPGIPEGGGLGYRRGEGGWAVCGAEGRGGGEARPGRSGRRRSSVVVVQ